MKRLLKPATVLKKWKDLCKKIKNDNTRRRTPGSKEAKRHAAMCGMKSMLEVEVAAQLDKMKIKWKYEPEKLPYHLCPKWCQECDVQVKYYIPDFKLANGIYIEVKGKMTLDTRKKMEAVLRCNPDTIINILFGEANNKLYARKNSTRYWEWAEKVGFKWSHKEVKKEWVS